MVRTCSCFGDPHCISFDQDFKDTRYDIFVTVSCIYTLVTDDCSSDGGSFEISANFKRVKPTTLRTKVSNLIIREGSNYVYLGQGLTAAFLNRENFVTPPHDEYGMTLRKVARGVIELTLANGIRVRWDGHNRVDVDAASGVPTCGICGNNDGNPNDDRAMGPHTENSRTMSSCPGLIVLGVPGFQAKSNDDFVRSWFKEKDVEDPFCEEDCANFLF